MSTKSMLAEIGMTRDQVARVARRYAKPLPKPHEPGDLALARSEDDERLVRESLAEAIADRQPGHVPDAPVMADTRYQGSVWFD